MGWIVAGIYGAILAVAFSSGGTDLGLAVLLAVVALNVGFRLDLASRAISQWADRSSGRERAHSPS